MELQTISEVSRFFNISTRTLRYYEQLGLIRPTKKEDFSYRTYDAETVTRLKQIIILRKLRIPLKTVTKLLDSRDAAVAIQAFQQNLDEINGEMTALSTIKGVILTLLERLKLRNARLSLLDDENLLDIVDSLTASKINFKEETSMSELHKASEKVNKLTDKDVRIIYLPPATVAAARYVGDEPERAADKMMKEFLKTADLKTAYPASRQFGFNSPDPGVLQDDIYGYEIWVTIPDDMEVPEPLAKKRMEGGMYAAHVIFPEDLNGTGWGRLYDWQAESQIWEGDIGQSGENMHGLVEEYLNYLNRKMVKGFQQFDLLMPIKKRETR
jgi:DNA-binding transcriptional MerR regulator